MTATPCVLVLGARGRFGRAAAQAFAQAGWRVLAQVRPGARELPPLAGVQWLPLPPHDTAALAAAAAGCAVVVHALSPVYTHRAWRRDLPGLTRAAIDAARALGATLLMPGTVYNFGRGMPRRLLEDTPQDADTFKGRMRAESERMVEAATRDGRMRAVVIRAGDFFGSGRGSWFDQAIAKDLARGRMQYPGPLDVATPWAYLPDLARAFVAVANRRERLPAFERLHFAGHQLTGAQWAEALQGIAREQGWIAPAAALRVSRLPWPLLRVLGLALPTLAALCEMRYLWETPHQLAGRRLEQLCGPLPQTPLRQALRESLAELGMLQGGGAPRQVTA